MIYLDRYLVIVLLPRVVMLDGLFVTSEERTLAEAFVKTQAATRVFTVRYPKPMSQTRRKKLGFTHMSWMARLFCFIKRKLVFLDQLLNFYDSSATHLATDEGLVG